MNLRQARIHAQSLAAAELAALATRVVEDEVGRYTDVDGRRIATYLRSMARAHLRRAAKLRSQEAEDS